MIRIQRATEQDIPQIEGIMLDVIQWLDSIGQSQWDPEAVTWAGLSKHFSPSDFYIATIDEMPVGCMALIDHDPAFWPHIEKGQSLFVHKLAIKRCGANQGVSTALLDYAKNKSQELGINEVRLDCHQNKSKVRAMYERQGFDCVDERCLFGKYHTAFYLWTQND